MFHRRATTLVELLLLLALIGTMAALALPPITTALDGAAVRAASQDVETLFAAAREQALARQTIVWVVFDGAAASVRLRIPGGGTRTRALGSIYGVALHATRDSMSYDHRGLGRGAANLTVVLVRGRARATLVVSRLGRVRR
ncbi:MAG: GspH/FimT family pseudopilin [Gemmatimonadaceae bacterium]